MAVGTLVAAFANAVAEGTLDVNCRLNCDMAGHLPRGQNRLWSSNQPHEVVGSGKKRRTAMHGSPTTLAKMRDVNDVLAKLLYILAKRSETA